MNYSKILCLTGFFAIVSQVNAMEVTKKTSSATNKQVVMLEKTQKTGTTQKKQITRHSPVITSSGQEATTSNEGYKLTSSDAGTDSGIGLAHINGGGRTNNATAITLQSALQRNSDIQWLTKNNKPKKTDGLIEALNKLKKESESTKKEYESTKK